jgi:DNA-binding ferritin-like protein
MDELINIIQNFGLPVGIMLWMMTIGQKTLNDIVCNMKNMVDSNNLLHDDIKEIITSVREASDKETRTILEWMLEQTKKK